MSRRNRSRQQAVETGETVRMVGLRRVPNQGWQVVTADVPASGLDDLREPDLLTVSLAQAERVLREGAMQ